jgi:hypothetical protein
MAWQITIMADERLANDAPDDDGSRGHVAKWEGGGPQNRYERVRFSPWPHVHQAINAVIGASQALLARGRLQ